MPCQGNTKTCTLCGSDLPRSSFYGHKATADRLRPECKSCVKERARVHRANNKPRKDLTTALWRANNRDKVAQYDRTTHNRYPARLAARIAVGTEVRAGRMKAEKCSACGLLPRIVKGRQRIQAHHYKGYDPEHWLDVVWLCVRCHWSAESAIP